MNGSEIIILLVLVAIIVGPQRLPQYAEQLARLVRTLRDMARGATQSIKEELGPEAADLDFTKLDPRQYDPRRIVRDALMDDLSPNGGSTGSGKTRSSSSRSSSGSGKGSSSGSAGSTAGAAAAGTATAAAGATAVTATETAPDDGVAQDPLADGAPFDTEAT